MTDGRRVGDSEPIPLAITDSDWSKLSDPEKSDLLRARHSEVVAGLVRNADATRQLVARVDDAIAPMLEANTAATARTEALIEASASKLDLLIARAERPLALWSDIEGTGSLIGRIGSFLKNAAWVVIPVGVTAGGAKALWAYITGPGPKP